MERTPSASPPASADSSYEHASTRRPPLKRAKRAMGKDSPPVEPEDEWLDDDAVIGGDEDDNFAEGDMDDLGGDELPLGLDLRGLRGLFAGTSSRFRELLTALQRAAGDPSARLMALQELSEALSMSTEDALLQLPLDATVAELVHELGGPAPERRGAPAPAVDAELAAVLAATADVGESQLYACRCLAYLLEVLPESAACIVRRGAIPLLVAQLTDISVIDLAEQVIQTLEKLSATHAPEIVREGGMLALLQYIDFFSIYVQRTAMATVANCCAHLSPASARRVAEIVPLVRNVLGYTDARLVESACRAVCAAIEAFVGEASFDELLIDVVPPVAALLAGGVGASAHAVTLGAATYADLLRALARAAASSAACAHALYEHGMLETLYTLLCGAPADAARPPPAALLQNLATRPEAQIREGLALAAALLPPLPSDGIFDARSYSEKAFQQCRRRAEREGCAIGELDDALDDAPVRRVSGAVAKQQRAIEARAAAQRAWPGFLARYAALLLPLCLDVYTASAAQEERACILSALLRSLWYTEPDTLRGALVGVPLASFLAGILARDGRDACVERALQAVELLVARLPDVYCALFVREGVVDEVDALAPDNSRARLVAERLRVVLAYAPGAREAHAHLSTLQRMAERLPAALPELGEALPHVTSYELQRSGLVDALYTCATSEAGDEPLAARRAQLQALGADARHALVAQLHDSISRLENLAVATVPSEGGAPLSQQLRLRLVADPATAARLPPMYHTMTVSVHAVVTTQLLHDFLRPKLELALAAKGRGPGLRGMLAALAAATGGNIEVLPGMHEDEAPTEGEVSEGPDESEASEAPTEGEGGDKDTDQVTDDAPESTDTPATLDHLLDEWPADQAAEIAEAPVEAETDTAEAPRRAPSYAAAAQSRHTAWHIEFLLGDMPMPRDATLYGSVVRADAKDVWGTAHTVSFRLVSGPAPKPRARAAPPRAPRAPGFEVALPASIAAEAPYARPLQLLGALHDLFEDMDDGLFVNTKLTAKLARQLAEPLVLASDCLPAWTHELPRTHAFLFQFDTRLRFFQSTALGYTRLLSLWRQDVRSDDVLALLTQLPRQKVRIARTSLLPSAVKTLELYGGASSVLEVEYFDEVGTGLGPTLEFYALVSREFVRADLGLWRSDGTSKVHGVAYVHAAAGLFPAPHAPPKAVALFHTLGQFVAKALLDARIIDVPFSPMFWRIVLGRRVPLTLATLAQVDAPLAASLERLAALPPDEVDALALDCVLPGTDTELGTSPVTAASLPGYIECVIAHTLRDGIAPQVDAFRNGFGAVLPLSTLDVFHSRELVALFGQSQEDWSEATLRRTLVPDHGFSSDSTHFCNLITILASFSPSERRSFLQWLTGSPRLPVGGFAALHPPLTVVKRQNEPPLQPDDYLPSVMTCVNYLKLPCYSTCETMRARLTTAMHEGLTSFHLS